jgi:hypothetical protein
MEVLTMSSKKELLKRIEALEAQVRRLENMHATIRHGYGYELPSFMHLGRGWEDKHKRVGYYNSRQLTSAEIELQPFHPQPKQVDYKCITNVPASTVETDRIPRVTLEELARLVIDGTPIRREEKVLSKRISEYTEDTTTTITIPE